MVSVLTSFASPVVRHAWTGCSGLRQQEAWPGANGEGVCVKPVTLTDDTQLTLLASDTCTHTLSPFLFCSAWVTLPFNISFLFFKLWLWRYRYLLPDFTFRKYIQFTFKIYNGKKWDLSFRTWTHFASPTWIHNAIFTAKNASPETCSLAEMRQHCWIMYL